MKLFLKREEGGEERDISESKKLRSGKEVVRHYSGALGRTKPRSKSMVFVGICCYIVNTIYKQMKPQIGIS